MAEGGASQIPVRTNSEDHLLKGEVLQVVQVVSEWYGTSTISDYTGTGGM